LLRLISAPLISPSLPSLTLCSYEIEKKGIKKERKKERKRILLNLLEKETRRKQWTNSAMQRVREQ
jgi:hypothetical protein